eukprot:COSAG05_NODE_588_length_8503_cov_54.867563_2_plen_1332_part_00
MCYALLLLQYMEMHSSFLTVQSVYLLLCNGHETTAEKEDKLRRWATLLSVCAPGATVLLVCSHADEVTDEATLQRRCERMFAVIQEELQRHRQAQEQELERLMAAGQACSVESALRIRRLQTILVQPLPLQLRPSGSALAVSAKTLQGIEELKSLLLETAFDKDCFPRFGNIEPSTYGRTHRFLRWTHPSKPSLTWGEMQETLRVSDALTTRSGVAEEGPLQVQRDGQGEFVDCFVSLSDRGVMLATDASEADRNEWTSTGMSAALSIGEPKSSRKGHTHCIRVDLFTPDSIGTRKYIFSCRSEADKRRWQAGFEAISQQLREAQNVRVTLEGQGQVVSSVSEGEYVRYSFVVASNRRPAQQFAVRFSAAKRVHGLLPSSMAPVFEAPMLDHNRDMVHDVANVRRRGKALESYYQQLLQHFPVASLLPALQEALDRPSSINANEFGTLIQQYTKLAPKLQQDSQLLERAMIFLRLTGEVLCHDTDLHHISQRERVFLRPQWLVDVMKEFVRHDFEQQLQQIDPSECGSASPELIRQLGQSFVAKGELDRRLLPWIWRDLRPSVIEDQAQMDFLVDLLVKLGLLTRMPRAELGLARTSSHSDEKWLLPMRLPTTTLAQLPSAFGANVSSASVDEVSRRYEFHQPLPSGLIAHTISGCALICNEETHIFREGLTTQMPSTDVAGGVIEVAIVQESITSIVLRARTASGRHHRQCLQQMALFTEILDACVEEKWPGCSASIVCLSPRLAKAEGVDIRICERALARFDNAVRVGAARTLVPLTELLAGSAPRFDPAVRARLAQLRFLRDMGEAMAVMGGNPSVRRFCASLDAALEAELGGTFEDGHSWSSLLSMSARTEQTEPELEPETQLHVDLGADEPEPEPEPSTQPSSPSVLLSASSLTAGEAEAVQCGSSRALALIETLGRLYEQSHEQPMPLPGLVEHLLGPFPWLVRTVCNLAEEHKLGQVPALASVFGEQAKADAAKYESAAPTEVPTTAAFPIVTMAEREYDFFINHCQGSGQDQCANLAKLLEAKGAKVWYDMQAQDLTAQGMERGVSRSRNVLMFLSDDLMGRPFCQAEQRWGKMYGCHFVGVVEKDTRHNPADFGKEKERAPADLKHLLDDVEFIDYCRRDWMAEAMVAELLRQGGVTPSNSPPAAVAPSSTVAASEPEPEIPEGVPPALPPIDSYHGLTNEEDFQRVFAARTVHIISAPYYLANPVSGEKAAATKRYHDNAEAGVYTFNPNSGLRAAAADQGMSEEEQGREWLRLWTEVLQRVKVTGGKCFVMAKGTEASYTLEGGAQKGEVNVAKFALDPEERGHKGMAGWVCDRIVYVPY